MKVYTKFLEITAKSDDDDKIEKHEVGEIRNQARVAAMLAKKELVVCLADFVANLERTRNLHMEDPERKGAFQQVIISMREDLDVVDALLDQKLQRNIQPFRLRRARFGLGFAKRCGHGCAIRNAGGSRAGFGERSPAEHRLSGHHYPESPSR